MLFLARNRRLKNSTARTPVRKVRSITKCAPVRKEAAKSKKAPEVRPAIDDAAWAARLQSVQQELAMPKAPRTPRVGDVHPFVRKQIKKVLPALCETFLDKAKEGDVSTMKLLWQMAELDKQTEQAGNSSKDRKFVRQAIAKFRKR
jgi:hypothetical protein